jgi:Zn-dependent protease with chaperone function
MAPLLGLFGIQASVAARFEPQLRGRNVTAGGALLFGFRSFVALSLLPVFLMSLLDFVPQQFEAVRRLSFVYPFLGWLVLLVPLVGLVGLLPVLLRVAFAAKPLPPGPVRERMEKLCRESDFDCGDLLVVSTLGLRLANAFIVGFIPAWRYVFFTDEILRGMTPVELECVLAHEIVHSKKGHILSFFYMVLGFALSNALTVELMERAKVAPALLLVIMLAWAGFFWGVVFGFVSRRFETEADLVAARMATPWEGGTEGYPAARGMAGALETVAWLNHMPLRAWSWRHFDIATRIRILLDAESNPSLGRSFERLCARLRKGALALVGVGLLCGALVCLTQLESADRNRGLLQAYDRLERGQALARERKFEEAAAELGAGLEVVREDGRSWLLLSECDRALGREEAARRAEDQARALHPADPGLRLRLSP